jgi:hypothetical protein
VKSRSSRIRRSIAERRIQQELLKELEEFFHLSFDITGFETDADYATFLLERYESRDDYAARASHASQIAL